MTGNRVIFVVFLGMAIFVGSISYSFAENEMSSNMIQSPKKQIESGILPQDVICKEIHVLVMRDNGRVACVQESTANKMNWDIVATEFEQKQIVTNQKDQVENVSNSVDVADRTDVYSNTTTNSTDQIISGDISQSDLLNNIPYPMFVQKISDKRLSTTSDDPQSTSSIRGISPWPKTTLDTPSQVRLGEPFDVTFTWSMVEFDKETGEIDDISPGDEGPEGVSLKISMHNGTKIISSSGFELVAERIDHYNITTSEYQKRVSYDDTKIHSETITLQIDKPMGESYNDIRISADGSFHKRYFTYSGDIVGFDGKPTYVQFGDELDTGTYQGVTIRENDENAQPNPEFIDSLADFIKNNITTQNMTQYLQDEGLSDGIIDALLQKYPELKN